MFAAPSCFNRVAHSRHTARPSTFDDVGDVDGTHDVGDGEDDRGDDDDHHEDHLWETLVSNGLVTMVAGEAVRVPGGAQSLILIFS